MVAAGTPITKSTQLRSETCWFSLHSTLVGRVASTTRARVRYFVPSSIKGLSSSPCDGTASPTGTVATGGGNCTVVRPPPPGVVVAAAARPRNDMRASERASERAK